MISISLERDAASRVLGLARGARLHLVRLSANRSLELHEHERWGIALPLEGLLAEEGRRFGTRYAVAGEALVIPPGETHRNGAGRRGCRHLLVETGPDPDTSPSGRLTPRVQRLMPEVSEAVRELAALLVETRAGRHGEAVPGGQRETASPGGLLSELCALVVDGAAAGDGGARDTTPPWLESIRERVLQEPVRTPTLAELAEMAGVHPSTVLRRFRAAYGVTPAGLARRRRLEEAAHRLRCTGEDISRIAHALGFADQSHLTRAFRSRFGLPPAAYRSRAKG